MQSYAVRRGRAANFVVKYRFLAELEGGRRTSAHQHIRYDFQYDDDQNRAWMIWPEFIDSNGIVLPEGPVPTEGLAQMFVLDDALIAFHQQRLVIGQRGYMVEGARRVAECEVVQLGMSSQ